MISPASSSNWTPSMTTSRSTPTTRAHTLFDCTPFALALLPALDSRKAKPGNGVHPRMLSYPPTERGEEPQLIGTSSSRRSVTRLVFVPAGCCGHVVGVDVRLVPALERDKAVVRRLLELDSHDFSEIDGRDLGPHGE